MYEKQKELAPLFISLEEKVDSMEKQLEVLLSNCEYGPIQSSCSEYSESAGDDNEHGATTNSSPTSLSHSSRFSSDDEFPLDNYF